MDPVQWLEKMTTTANTVICVVNEQFHKSLETPFLRALSLLISADRFNGGVGASDGAVSVHYY